MKFQVCLQELSKSAGLLDTIKDVAMTEVANTKPWVIGRKKPLTDSLRSAGNAVSGVRSAVRPAAQSGVRSAVRGAGGAYDVSAMARKMGI